MILREVLDYGYIRNARPNKTIRGWVEKAVTNTKTLRKVLGLNRPIIGYIKKSGGGIAVYANGSAKDPIILIADETMVKCGADEHQVYITLIHELFHAYLETIGMWITEFTHDEDLIEDIARDYGGGYILAKTAAEKLRHYAAQSGVEC